MVDRRSLRELVEAPGILVMPGAFNGFSVRLVEEAGFKADATSDTGRSESPLGWADRIVLTFNDNLRACRALAHRAGIPLLAPDPLLPFGELNALMGANQFDSIEHKLATP